MNYTHLAREERYQISAVFDAGLGVRAAAQALGRSPSTISRERARNASPGGHYHPGRAHQRADRRQRVRARRPRISQRRWHEVERRLKDGWSPEQIAGRLRREGRPGPCHTRIYQYVRADRRRGGELHRSLRCRKSKRKRYGGATQARGQIHGTALAERPARVAAKARYGDWEADTVYGRKAACALITMVERKSQYLRLRRVSRRLADPVAEAMLEALLPLRDLVHTITLDRGKEFAAHARLHEPLGAHCYLADPYCAWQRGLNEQVNGLIRQYVPKGTDLLALDESTLREIERRLNHRPRKRLGYLTPHEVLSRAARQKGVALPD